MSADVVKLFPEGVSGDCTADDVHARILARLNEMGTFAGRRIMGNVAALGADASVLSLLVDDVCASVRSDLLEAGTTEATVEELVDVFRRETIREGKRIAMALGPHGGTA